MARPSTDGRARFDVPIRLEEHHAVLVAVGTEDEHFGREARDPLDVEPEHAHDLPTEERILRVVGRLGARTSRADVGAEVDRQLVRRVPRLREVVDLLDHADPQVEPFELVPRRAHRRKITSPSTIVTATSVSNNAEGSSANTS